ncbi:sigma factor [Dechloromonas sp. HYN0024]|uniref:sigma factor n=1 Tax=Dechloromonas sp. HYN0024 TaxID=2231055 RepID=UPI0026C34850
MAIDPLHDPEFLTGLRRDMLRFAEMQLRDRAQAEDAVQEALTGALMGKEKFSSRASLRTWVLAILKTRLSMSCAARFGRTLWSPATTTTT